MCANVAFDRNNNEITDTRLEYKERYGDGSHGNTTACLAAGSQCGVAPEAEIYIFSVGDIEWSEAQETMLKYIKQEIENGNMKIPDIISMSANINATEKANELLTYLAENGCITLDSNSFWKDFSWGRKSDDGRTISLDGLMKTIISNKYDENSRAGKIAQNVPNTVLIPCTERTTIHIGEDGETIYKYNGSLCGASYAIPQIAGLFLLARQIDESISYDDFIQILRNSERINTENMIYADARENIESIGIIKTDVLKSALEATEESTRIGVINEQAQTIKNIERAKTQEPEQNLREQ